MRIPSITIQRVPTRSVAQATRSFGQVGSPDNSTADADRRLAEPASTQSAGEAPGLRSRTGTERPDDMCQMGGGNPAA